MTRHLIPGKGGPDAKLAIMTLLSIAGFDPTSGAGLTADLMVFAAHGLFGTACATALTVQSTRGVTSIDPVRGQVVRDTLACLQDDLPANGVKIGMLATKENVDAVADFLVGLRASGQGVPTVLDPVLRSSSGVSLLTDDGLASMKTRLLPVVDWVTPNLAELEVLTGLAVKSLAEMEKAAQALQRLYPGLGVVATGGHLDSRPDDLVLDGSGQMVWLRGDRIESEATHGTGCVFSSAFLCGLMSDSDGEHAGIRAKSYVAGGIRHAPKRGSGKGPMRLLWQEEAPPGG